jgi:hypothetical protein
MSEADSKAIDAFRDSLLNTIDLGIAALEALPEPRVPAPGEYAPVAENMRAHVKFAVDILGLLAQRLR